MSKDILRQKTKKFALDIIKLASEIPDNPSGKVIRYQIVKSGTSVGANYRASIRSKSPADFISKMGIAEEEADESMFWLEILHESGMMKEEQIKKLYNDGDEILAMTVASIWTAKGNKNDK